GSASRFERLGDCVVDEEVAVEARDLERAASLETGCGETEPAAVGHPRTRLDQHAEGGRVDEPDLSEIDDEHLWFAGTCSEQCAAHLLGAVEVELALQREDNRTIATGGSDHRRLTP